jgi:hypothetical protein
MEHSSQSEYIGTGRSHPPSCSLVSCLSLNLPALKPSAHGLDITTNSTLTSPLLAIDLSSFETLPKLSLAFAKAPSNQNRLCEDTERLCEVTRTKNSSHDG